jgi:TRAP-type uncharacterized transport system substrate-binding protein
MASRGQVNWDLPGPVNMRSALILETIAEMVRPRWFPAPVVQVNLGRLGQDGGFKVSSEDGADLVPLVARGEIDVAMLNPSALLHAAYYGTGPYAEPHPMLRAISVMPSLDWFIFAVTEKTGLTSLAEVKDRRYPLRISIRPPAALKMYVDATLRAYGFSLEDVVSWGGSVSYDRAMPFLPERYERVKRDEIDAIFDEGVARFIPMLADLGMRILPLEEPILQQMDAIHLQRHVLPRSLFPMLPVDIPTLDFSGWPVYTRVDAPDDLVYQFCRALDARKASIPWEAPGPLPTGDMCRDTPSGPLKIPLHPAAERYWREAGYLGDSA